MKIIINKKKSLVQFLGKTLHCVGSATVCSKSEVILNILFNYSKSLSVWFFCFDTIIVCTMHICNPFSGNIQWVKKTYKVAYDLLNENFDFDFKVWKLFLENHKNKHKNAIS